jgi:hypothetical protein
MKSRYLPIAVFVGCVMFSILHAVGTRMTGYGHHDRYHDYRSDSDDYPIGPQDPRRDDRDSVAPFESGINGRDPRDPSQIRQAGYRDGDGGREKKDKLVTIWEDKLILMGNQQAGGQRQPGVRGNLEICMGPAGRGVEATGEIHIELFEQPHHTHIPVTQAGTEPLKVPRKVQEWHLDAGLLRNLAKRDERGDISYAFDLPFPNYRPEIDKISLKVTYHAANGETLSDDSNSFDLKPNNELAGWQPPRF